MDKVQITLQPALPATCAVCHRSANGHTKFLDFQADLDYYGAIVICEECAVNMLEVLDFVPVAQFESALENFSTMEEAYLVVKAENERLRGALDSILLVRTDLAGLAGMDSEGQESTDSEGSGENPEFDG